MSRPARELIVIELLNAIVETFTAFPRPSGGQVLKFLGDGMLATFPFLESTRLRPGHLAIWPIPTGNDNGYCLEETASARLN